MMDILKAHFRSILIVVCVFAAIMLVLAVVLFRDLENNYEQTRKAMLRFVQFIRGLRGAVKGDPAPAIDPLSQTISEPVKAPPNPLASAAQQPTSTTGPQS